MPPDFDPGQLNQRLRFERRATGLDAFGQASTTWQHAFTVWGRAQPLRGREFFAAMQVQAETTVRFTVRHRADIDPTQMRVVWRDQPHDISAALPLDGGTEWLEIMAQAGVKDGL
jgi:SPP1 family predicted phage head-tail adaptor